MSEDKTPKKATPKPGPSMFKQRTQSHAVQSTPADAKPQTPKPKQKGSTTSSTGTQTYRGHSRRVTGLPEREFFINPYNFVPLHTRRDTSDDGPPSPQGVWHEGHYSGHITIEMKTETPLLTVRREQLATESASGLLTVRKDPDDNPAINGSSVKGMLRSLFEQATGSRLGVFGHNKPLSYRRSADDARGLKLAKVTRKDDTSLGLTVMHGIQPSQGWGSYPVWAEVAALAPFDYGSEVYMWLDLLENNHRKAWFPQTIGRTSSEADTDDSLQFIDAPAGWTQDEAPQLFVRAKLHNTGHTISGKKFERVFVEEIIKAEPITAPHKRLLDTSPISVSDDDYRTLVTRWQAQIDSMSGDPATDNNGRELDLAPYANKDAPGPWKTLNPGQLLFVDIDQDGQVTGIYPGMITREMRKCNQDEPDLPNTKHTTPTDLVPHDFRPAQTANDLSPADRVFGWVASKADKHPSAYRGLLAVGGVHCTTDDAVETFPPVRLATLAEPKSSQFRFYTRTRTQDAKNQPGRIGDIEVSEGFDPSAHVIAGHKVYPHHGNNRPGYWDKPTDSWQPDESGSDADPVHPTTPNGQPLDYLAPVGTKQKVSSNLDSWVRPGVTFETRIRVTNLSSEDLGALLWILELKGHHRLGLGKPLGFGSLNISIDWDRTVVRDHAQLVERYSGLTEGQKQAKAALCELSQKFDDQFRSTQPAVYRAMVASAKGYSGEVPVHYPRTQPGHPQAEGFHWFVSNDRGEHKKAVPPRHSLPLLGSEDPKLPTLKKRRGD